MIGSERMTAYINSLDQGYPAYLEQIERVAQEASIPIIRKEVQSFLRTVLSIGQPRRILPVPGRYWRWGRLWVFPRS